MTWTWDIGGLGTTEQTLTVWNPDGETVASETREAWTWSDPCPEYVEEVVSQHDFQAVYMENIERAE